MKTSPPLTIGEWSDAEWHSRAEAWNSLLSRTGPDRLFLGWEWLTAWWRHFGNRAGHELRVRAAYRGDLLVGLAPFYVHRVTRRRVPARSLQFVGTAWRDDLAFASPYQDVIASPDERDEVRSAILASLAPGADWNELVVGFSREPDAWKQTLRAPLGGAFHARTIEASTSYQADLTGGFDDYLRRLGQSTRRSVWHLRRRLSDLGTARVDAVAPDQLELGFAHLNRLHHLRWGKAAFEGARLRFHLDVARVFAQTGGLSMSLLSINDEVVSVLYDLRKDGTQYNLKMAFDPAVERRFSLGLLHFGFALEAAACAGVGRYDFLAGPGQQTDFKSHLAQERRALATVQILTGAILRALYRWHDAFVKPTP